MIIKGSDKKIEDFKNTKGSILTPSAIAMFERCGASVYIKDVQSTGANKGTELHSFALDQIQNHLDKKPVEEHDKLKYLNSYIANTIKILDKYEIVGVEVPVLSRLGHCLLKGYVDLFYYDEKDKTLYVVDLKTGINKDLDMYRKQLDMYAAMVCETFDIIPDKIVTSVVNPLGKIDLDTHTYKETLAIKNKLTHLINTRSPEFKATFDNCTKCFKLTNCADGKTLILDDASDKKISTTLKHFVEHDKTIGSYEIYAHFKVLKKSIDKIVDTFESTFYNIFKLGNEELKKKLNFNYYVGNTKRQWDSSKIAEIINEYGCDIKPKGFGEVEKQRTIDLKYIVTSTGKKLGKYGEGKTVFNNEEADKKLLEKELKE